MKVIGIESVRLDRLRLPGNWRKILSDDRVHKIVASRKHVGILQEPIVRASDMRPLCGLGRIASCAVLQEEEVTVKLVECTDEEAVIVTLAENGVRTHDSAKAASLEKDLLAMLEAREPSNDPPWDGVSMKRGRPKNPKIAAREMAAEASGLKPETLRMREYRDKVKNAPPVLPAEPTAPPFRTIGRELHPTFIRQVAKVHEDLSSAAKRLSAALSDLTRLEKSGLPYRRDRVDRLKEDLRSLSEAFRSMRPAALCPSCKGVDDVQNECAGCATVGYITEGQVASVPSELWDEESPVVLFRGYQRPLSEFAEEVAPKVSDPLGLEDL